MDVRKLVTTAAVELIVCGETTYPLRRREAPYVAHDDVERRWERGEAPREWCVCEV